MQYQKVQSVAKKVLGRGSELDKVIRSTLAKIASVVGSTLGPGGHTVLIERQEENLPPMVTKDGVTVFRALGFSDPAAQNVMEAARDAAVRTANEAGDGTTSATVLADAIDRYSHAFRELPANRHVSPQKVVRRLAEVHAEVVTPAIARLAVPADPSTDEGQALLWRVARSSANGDDALADAVMTAYRVIGDEGNVTITEISGPTSYEVEKIDGYTIPVGWDDCCGKYGPKFLNDPGQQRTVLEDPAFVVYHGQVTEIQSVVKLMESVAAAWQSDKGFRHNIVLVATGFSESVVAQLAMNFQEVTSINVFPVLAPLSPVPGGQLGLLEDVCAVTGARMFDPLNRPFDNFDPELSDLGQLAQTFEVYRFRSSLLGGSGDAALLVEERVGVLEEQLKQAASSADTAFIKERIGKLTGGLARLKVVGSSNGENRERRDRAEDAVCAVRGAIEHGCLPGGGWVLVRLIHELRALHDPIVDGILVPALREPVILLFRNVGFDDKEIEALLQRLEANAAAGTREVYDALEHRWVDALSGGVLDSVPAVREAIKNALSIASQLGTTGGIISFHRDLETERREARETSSFLRDSMTENPADARP